MIWSLLCWVSMSTTSSTKALTSAPRRFGRRRHFLFVTSRRTRQADLVGSKKAAACTKGQRDCLPDVNYVDHRQGVHAAELAARSWSSTSGRRGASPARRDPGSLEGVRQVQVEGVVMLGVMTDTPTTTSSSLPVDFEITTRSFAPTRHPRLVQHRKRYRPRSSSIAAASSVPMSAAPSGEARAVLAPLIAQTTN